jgi:N-acetylmuramoyl-L-alanine amidase
MQTYIFKLIVSFIIVLTFGSTQTITAQSNDGKFVVVLDAGHGGDDPGNLGNGHKEKDIALKIVLEVGKALEAKKDFKVIYTRKTDVFIELRERAAIANRADADLFVSVHCNSHSSQASGTETFVLGVANTKRNFDVAKKENEVIFLEKDYKKNYKGFDPNAPESLIGLALQQEDYVEQSIKLARLIEDNFIDQSKRKSRGIKQASLWVLHNTYMPSVLVEVGFLTNNAEGKFLNSKSGQSKMATSILKAVNTYKKSLDLNVGDNYIVDPVIEDTISTDEKTIKNTVFKIQIAASAKALEPKAYNFKGLKEISREKQGRLYKYYYGYTSDYNVAQKLQIEAKNKGYKDAYIVALKDGKQIKLSEALKTESN